MKISRIISLTIAGLYVGFFIFVYVTTKNSKIWSAYRIIPLPDSIFIYLFIALISIWKGDKAGELLIGKIDKPSPGWLVKLMGWVLLLLPLVLFGSLWILSHL